MTPRDMSLIYDLDDLLRVDRDNRTLRRWFARLDAIGSNPAVVDGDIQLMAAQALVQLLRAMSHRLPSQRIELSRIKDFSTCRMDLNLVEEIRQRGDYGEPIVVIGNLYLGPLELADGRHRVTAARADGVRFLNAIMAANGGNSKGC